MASAFPDLLGSMQGQLGQLYDVEVPHDVRDYLVTDRALLAALTAGNPGRSADEQLIVVEKARARWTSRSTWIRACWSDWSPRIPARASRAPTWRISGPCSRA